MKLFFKRLFARILQPFGFYVTYYPSANKVYEVLKNRAFSVQEFELTRVFGIIALAKNHKAYDQLIRVFTTNQPLKYKKVTFIGSGSGSGSLSFFRKITTAEEKMHEKIYYTSHQDFERVSWFYKEMYPLVESHKIKVPALLQMCGGDVITVVYTDYQQLKIIKTPSVDSKELIRFTEKLYFLSLQDSFAILSEGTPEIIKSFEQHFEYVRNIDKATKILLRQGVDIVQLEAKIKESRKVLSHGDIQNTNAFGDGVLIDWDSVGIFPLGFDVAYLIFYLLINVSGTQQVELNAWLAFHYKTVINEDDWEDFELNFNYFLFVFIQERMRNKEVRQMYEDVLIQNLQKMLK